MSFLLTCPNCGVRRVDEFRFGGEYRERPQGTPSVDEWGAYLYERTNVAGLQREWWYHRQGCKQWFIGTRDTVTNTVHSTAWFAPEKGTQDAQEHHPDSTATA
jgi:sarcosine oxidase subunit delta